jgi:hypothetical protein
VDEAPGATAPEWLECWGHAAYPEQNHNSNQDSNLSLRRDFRRTSPNARGLVERLHVHEKVLHDQVRTEMLSAAR